MVPSILFFMAIIAIGLILYWQLIIAEGSYLGSKTVTYLYDITAERYNRIKGFEEEFEDWAIGEPLANRLHNQPKAVVLDVATGTGRIPLNLLRQPDYQGHVVGLDRAARMLAIARRDTASQAHRVSFIQADASALPFATGSFPAVTCIEALEFLPNPKAGLQELTRVLASATPHHPQQGWLLTSRRIGWEAWLLPGKTWSRDRLKTMLETLSLQYIEILPWQDIYNIVWAQKTELGRND